MSKHKNYQTLVTDYKELLQFGRKLGLVGGIIQFSILIFINAWKHMEIPYFKVAAPILFALCLYLFAKDFSTFLKVDKYGAHLISDGFSLEKKNASFGKFFHEILEDFNLVKILLQRSLVNLIAFGCLGYLLSQFVVELNSELVISHRLLVLISIVLTIIGCKFYYDSLKFITNIKSLGIKAARR